MTLSTNVYVHGKVNPTEIHAICNRLLEAPPTVKYDDSESWGADKTRRTISNAPMQGLPAWLMVHYRDGAALWPEGEPHGEWCDEDCTSEYHDPPCWLIVNFDTAYSYHDGYGGCGDLHARLVDALGKVFEAAGVTWSWRNEFTGEVHVGRDGLDELGTGGREAATWLHDVVLPAIGSGRL